MIAFIPMARPTGRYFGSKSKRRTKDQKEITMQIGMIGLGRMGANMAWRLIRKGHTCVVFNRSPQAVIRIFQDLLATSPTLVKDAGPLLRSMKQYRPQFSRRRFISDSVLG